MNSKTLGAAVTLAFGAMTILVISEPAVAQNCEGWHSLNSGFSGFSAELAPNVQALAVFDDGSGPALHVGGHFHSVGGQGGTSLIARWDGSEWSSVGGGLGVEENDFLAAVNALTVFDDGSGPALYAAGSFTTAGGVSATNIARWDGSEWSSVGGGITGEDIFARVRDLAVFDDGLGPALYAAGSFSEAGGEAIDNVAKWDGISWSSLGADWGGSVNSLAVFDDGTGPALHVAGSGVHVRKWDGGSWSTLDALNCCAIYALHVHDDGNGPALYAGGAFSQNFNRIAKWDGSSWSALGDGVDAEVYTFETFDDGAGPALYVGGNFFTAGGEPAYQVARWDGITWWSLEQDGIDPDGEEKPVWALRVFDDGDGPMLYIGGGFESSPAGDESLTRWCWVYDPPSEPEPEPGECIVASDGSIRCDPKVGEEECVEATEDAVTLCFDEVTASGIITIIPIHELDDPTGVLQPPAGVTLDNPIIYAFETTAEFSGDVSVAFSWAENHFQNENSVVLLHSPDGQEWTDITTSVDLQTRTVFGVVSGFSFIGAFEPTVLDPIAVCLAYPSDNPANAGSEITVGASVLPVEITLDGSGSFDPDGHTLSFQWQWFVGRGIPLTADPDNPAIATAEFPLGTHTAGLAVQNELGGIAFCDVIITVVEEATEPATVFVTSDVDMLWPPNHTMRDVQVIVTAIDFLEDPFEVFPVQVLASSSEPDNAQGNGDGNTTGDTNGEDGYTDAVDITDLFVWNPNFFSVGDGAWVATIQLRAERAGGGDGRVYTIELEALDLYNLNLGVSSIPIVVPRGMGGGGN